MLRRGRQLRMYRVWGIDLRKGLHGVLVALLERHSFTTWVLKPFLQGF